MWGVVSSQWWIILHSSSVHVFFREATFSFVNNWRRMPHCSNVRRSFTFRRVTPSWMKKYVRWTCWWPRRGPKVLPLSSSAWMILVWVTWKRRLSFYRGTFLSLSVSCLLHACYLEVLGKCFLLGLQGDSRLVRLFSVWIRNGRKKNNNDRKQFTENHVRQKIENKKAKNARKQ